MRIAHAIFTSLRGDKLDGYQLAAHSDGISDKVAQELSGWGPAHDSLLEQGPDAESINFHPLMDRDSFCLSRTTCSGAEYSGRTGGRIYTQMFLVSHAGLLQFGANPFFLLRAIAASGRLLVHDIVPKRLRSFPLAGAVGGDEQTVIESLTAEVGSEPLAELANALRAGGSVAVCGDIAPARLFQALFQSIPVDDRLGISFTTGLKTSIRRPFQLFVAPRHENEQRKIQRQTGTTLVEVRALHSASH